MSITVSRDESEAPVEYASTTWTREQTQQHCRERTLTNVECLSRITGIGQNLIYDEIARGKWSATRVLRVGRLIKIPTADILAMLGLTEDDGA